LLLSFFEKEFATAGGRRSKIFATSHGNDCECQPRQYEHMGICYNTKIYLMYIS
jgi:hypothetical protein